MYGITRFGSCCSILDFFHMGSGMSLRYVARAGSSVSTYGMARLGSSLSVLDFTTLGSSLSLRAVHLVEQ